MTDTYKYIDKFTVETIFKDFYFFNVGYETCPSNHSYGPDLREQYLLHYVAEGEGVFKTQGVTYYLKAGDFFLLRPNQLGFYQADTENPWNYYWFGFDGNQVEDILKLNGIYKNDAVGTVSNQKKVVDLFEDILETNILDLSKKIQLQSIFISLFTFFIIDENIKVIKNVDGELHRYSEVFLLYVQNNYYRHFITISEIAASMNLNSSYLTQVIKAELNMTPLDYLTEYRIGKGKILLSTSDLPVYEIAERIGYKSSQSLSRVFKNRVGCSPLEFRKRYKK